MRSHAPRFPAALAAALLALACGACAGTSLPTRYYVLTPAAPESAGAAGEGADADANSGPAIAVHTVRVPEHLARAQIARLSGSNRLVLAEFDQWAAPLDRALAEVLAENLALLVPSGLVATDVRTLPGAARFEVSVEVARFDLFDDGRVELAAIYVVRPPGDAEPLVRRGLWRQQAADLSIEAGVAAMSAAVLELSRDIAAAIR
jgi:uncharacterized lipoprotein YmbA